MSDKAAAAVAFARAAGLLEHLAGVRLTVKRVERAAEASGAALAAASRTAAGLIARRKLIPLPDKLYIVIDGTCVPVTARETAAAFQRLVKAEGIRRGADHVRQLTVIGDRAAWIWNLATATFPEATHIVDLYHAREHLHSLTRSLEFTLLDRTDQWLAARLEDLYHGDTDGIEAAVRCYPLVDGVKKDEVNRELGYLLTTGSAHAACSSARVSSRQDASPSSASASNRRACTGPSAAPTRSSPSAAKKPAASGKPSATRQEPPDLPGIVMQARVPPPPRRLPGTFAGVTSSSRPEHVCGRLDPGGVVPPGHLVEHAVAASAPAVDQLPDDVRVTRVLGGLGGHPDQQEAQRGVAPVLGPVRNLRGRVQVKLADDLVGVLAGAVVQPREVPAGLTRQRPHVGAVPDRAVLDPGESLRPRAAKRLTEVPVLQPGKVLDQPEQVRAGRCHRAAQVILTQALQPGQQRGPALAELAVQDFLQRQASPRKSPCNLQDRAAVDPPPAEP